MSEDPVAETATVAFVDLAGFSAITDLYGDSAAISVIEIFEGIVGRTLGDGASPAKWIGDEAMLSFSDPRLAIRVLGSLLSACREDRRLPLTRTALHHGPVIRRANDLFGSTVNIAARLAALAAPGQILATRCVADAAHAEGILVKDLGNVALRSLAEQVSLHEIQLAPTPDRVWIDPVCKMHGPYFAFEGPPPEGPWFCSQRCEKAYGRSPQTYPPAAGP